MTILICNPNANGNPGITWKPGSDILIEVDKNGKPVNSHPRKIKDENDAVKAAMEIFDAE